MALETLKGIEEIGGFKVAQREDGGYFAGEYIRIHQAANQITFKIQDGPIKEVGENGCQVDTIIETVELIILGLNDKFPCEENIYAMAGLKIALMWLNKRKEDRKKREVEGISHE